MFTRCRSKSTLLLLLSLSHSTVFNSIVFCFIIYFSGDTFLSLVKPNDSMDEMNQKMFIDVLQTGLDGIDANNVDDGRDGNGLKRMSSVPSGQLKRNSLASGSMSCSRLSCATPSSVGCWRSHLSRI